jgi:hypothetical protein
MRATPWIIGGVVLAARLLTLPRTPWDADELRLPFALAAGLSIAASVATAILLAWRDPVAAVLFSFAAAVMVHAPAARLDALAWMFLAASWLCVASRAYGDRPPPSLSSVVKAPMFGALLAAAIACQVSMTISAAAMLVAALAVVFRERRERTLAVLAFVVVLAPFVTVPDALTLPAEFSIARFTLHPWGSKFVALPLLIAVAAGIRPLLRRWTADLDVLLWFTLVHVAVGIALVDPREGVRYIVPALFLIAIAAAEGLKTLRVRWIGASVIVALSIAYALPLLRERVLGPSPLAQAIAAQRPGMEIVDGRASEPGAIVFSRAEGDAWGKLTRNAYRHASLVPVSDVARYGHGVYGIERNEAGESWRWLSRHAELHLRSPAKITFRLPQQAKIEANDFTVNGTAVRVLRGQSVTVAAQGPVSIDASRTFPLEAPDTRRVAVQLLRVER